jgi:hypothetical protein
MIEYLSYPTKNMDRSKLKQLLANLKQVVSELESEIYSDTETYLSYDDIAKCTPFIEDDDGYPD